MYIVIVGGGQLGAYLATTLLRGDNQVAIIEEEESAAIELSKSLMARVWLFMVMAVRQPFKMMQEQGRLTFLWRLQARTKITWQLVKLQRESLMCRVVLLA